MFPRRCLLVLALPLWRTAAPDPGDCFPAVNTEEAELLGVDLLQHNLQLGVPGHEPKSDGEADAAMEGVKPTTVAATVAKPSGETKLLATVRAFTLPILAIPRIVHVMCAQVSLIVFLWLSFCTLRLSYPVLYSHNVREGWAPKAPPETFFGWLRPTLSLTVDEVAESVTLDAAMLLEFSHLCMKILATLSIPMVGTTALNGQLRCWAQAFAVWGVVILVTRSLHLAMSEFLPRRCKWLRERPELFASTLMVECIPHEFRSEAKLRGFFQELLPGVGVKSVYMCRHTADLEATVSAHERACHLLKVSIAKWSNMGESPFRKPMIRDPESGTRVDAILFWRSQREQLMQQIKVESQMVQQRRFSSSAFVTFADAGSAEVALKINGDLDQWRLCRAPEPDDVLWRDLSHSDKEPGDIVNQVLSVGLCLVCIPLAVVMASSPVGLQIAISLVPLLLAPIFRNCCAVRSMAWQQQRLHIWCFWLQVALALVAPGLTWDTQRLAQAFVHGPNRVWGTLVENLQSASTFYTEFFVLQCIFHSLHLVRCLPLVKFKTARRVLDENDAKRQAEPTHYGIGGRSARWAMVMAIALIFGTLTPVVAFLALANFAICRVVYAYLMCFAEARTADLGGAYWVSMLRHLFAACIIYCIVLTGVLAHKSASCGPAFVAAPSILWVFFSKARFEKCAWEKLPIEELVQSEPSKRQPDKGQYIQPELLKAAEFTQAKPLKQVEA